MKVNLSYFLYSAAVMVALGSASIVHADDATPPAPKYKTISARLTIELSKREDKFVVANVRGSDGKLKPMLSRKEVPVEGKLTMVIDGLPKVESQAYKPDLSKKPLNIDVAGPGSTTLTAHTIPGSSSGDVAMTFSYPTQCYVYDAHARDQMISAETSAVSASVPAIVSRAINNPDASEFIQLQPKTQPVVVHVENSRGDKDECLVIGADLNKTVMTHEPSTLVVDVEMSVLDQGTLPQISLEEAKPEMRAGGFDFVHHKPAQN